MDIQGLAGLPGAGGVQKQTAADQTMARAASNVAGLPSAAPAGAPTQAAARSMATVPAATLAQAVDKLQKQIGQQDSSVALTAGLDPRGDHPGQVLVELKDQRTQQVFVHYYVPAEQVVRAAGQGTAQGVPPGTLLKGKA